jgi:hypothetical protein
VGYLRDSRMADRNSNRIQDEARAAMEYPLPMLFIGLISTMSMPTIRPFLAR